jgi:predicted amino acid-binding ACT domain protein
VKSNIAALPNWQVDVDEVSNGVYFVKAVHTLGSIVEITGIDVDQLLSEVEAAAKKLELDIQRKLSQSTI